ncbi:sulfatase family protein [Pelagicoccus mobilis]
MIGNASASEGVASRSPNVIIIVTDDHGYVDLGAYGLSGDIRTPHLDALAKGGALMTQGYVTAPQCIPSRAGIVTGRYQTRFGLDENHRAPLDLKEVTIAERMREAGYATGFVGKWHLEPNRNSRFWMERDWSEGLKQKNPRVPEGLRRPYLPVSRGFTDVYDGTMNTYLRNFDLEGNDLPLEREVDQETFRVDKQSEAALAFIKRHKDEPFFLYLAYYAPHVPIEVVKKHFDRFPGDMPERRRWALASIAAIDDGVGAIVEALREYGIEDDTIIFYFGDNGAPLKIHMADDPFNKPGWDGSLNGPMVGEKGMISEGGIRVPYLVYWKNHIPAQVYEAPVLSLDSGATALALAGVETEPGEIDGVDLMPHLVGGNTKDPHETLYWRFWGQSAIREGKWKFYELENGVRMLFDMDSEAHETKNVLKRYPEIADRLQQKLERWRDAQQRPGFSNKFGREAAWYRHYFGVK